MADAPRPPKPGAAPAASTFGPNHLQDTTIFLVVLLLLGAVVNRFIYYFQSGTLPLVTLWDAFARFVGNLWDFWTVASVALIGVCVWWAIYSKMKLHNIVKEEEKIFGKDAVESSSEMTSTSRDKGNEKWARVIEHVNSINPSDWRLAIIEADIMLDELLRAARYHGDTIGEMLKSVEPSDMLTLDAAWEAHKVRNRIAHSGSDFELSERETKRVISLFESVFKEFQII